MAFCKLQNRCCGDRPRTATARGYGYKRTALSSVRLDHSGRLIVGSIGALRGSGAKIHTAWAKRAIRKLFPQIGDFDLDYAWHGSIGMTDTHLPKFHRLEPQVLSISGYNGRGIAAGTVFGYLLAQLIMGEISEGGMLLPVTTIRVRRPCLKLHFVCTGIY